MFKGIDVILVDGKEIGKDEFNRPIIQEKKIYVHDVLVAPSSTNDITSSIDLTGKKAIYTLAIPKDDRHDWEGRKVIFFNKEWRVLGFPIEGIEENIPLKWNKKVMVERYD